MVKKIARKVDVDSSSDDDSTLESDTSMGLIDSIIENFDVFQNSLGRLVDDFKKRKNINSATEKLKGAREDVIKSLKALGQKKLAICLGAMTKFFDSFARLQNVEIGSSPELNECINFKFAPTRFLQLKDVAALAPPKDNDAVAQGTVALGAYGLAGALGQFPSSAGVAKEGSANRTDLTAMFFNCAPQTVNELGNDLVALGESVTGPMMSILFHVMLERLFAEAANESDSCSIPIYSVGLMSMSREKLTKDWKLHLAKFFAIERQLIAHDIELAVACLDKTKVQAIKTQIDALVETCKVIQTRVDMFIDLLSKLDKPIAATVAKLEAVVELFGVDYKAYPPKAQRTVEEVVSIAQAAQAMLETPLLDANGALTEASREVCESVDKFLSTVQ